MPVATIDNTAPISSPHPWTEEYRTKWRGDEHLQAIVQAEGPAIDAHEKWCLGQVLVRFTRETGVATSSIGLRDNLAKYEFHPILSNQAEDCPELAACKHMFAKGVLDLVDVRSVAGELKPFFKFTEAGLEVVLPLIAEGRVKA